VKALVLASWLGIALFLGPVSATAQDAPLEVNADAIKVSLERQVGKRVKLRLVSGQDLEGTVVAVGTAGVHIEHILRKLDLRSRHQVADWAKTHGLAPE